MPQSEGGYTSPIPVFTAEFGFTNSGWLPNREQVLLSNIDNDKLPTVGCGSTGQPVTFPIRAVRLAAWQELMTEAPRRLLEPVARSTARPRNGYCSTRPCLRAFPACPSPKPVARDSCNSPFWFWLGSSSRSSCCVMTLEESGEYCGVAFGMVSRLALKPRSLACHRGLIVFVGSVRPEAHKFT
jgi:hypothetical protein